jgi:ribonuclease R
MEGREPARDRGADGTPSALTESVVGVLARRGRLTVVEPFFERGGFLAVERTREAREGQLVLATSGQRSRGAARVLRVLGNTDNARAVLEAYMLHRGLARRFPPGVERAAAEAVERAQREDPGAAVRRDLRSLVTFTIDPSTAKDYDDAISAETLGDAHWRVWVHIADVSAHVRPGSPIDREAYRRSTSVYVPGLVEPMLPELLSNGACSLVPGEDRLTVTVELEIRGDQVVSTAAYRSQIRSDVRLDYDSVDRLFSGDIEPHGVWAGSLAAARAAAAMLRERRGREGALVISSSEQDFTFTKLGHVKDMLPSEQTESHQLIEHLMIAANEAVAETLSRAKVPTLYRVHERPDPESAERLLAQLASLGVPTPLATENISGSDAAGIIAAASQLIAQEAERRGGEGMMGLGSLILRSQKKAHYDPANLGHAGLHSDAYCHFTSPIRRYPDLVCHRALLSTVGGGEDPPRGGGPLAEAAVWTSARERDAMVIERGADDIARAFLLQHRMVSGELPAQWDDAEIVGLVGGGAFLRFGGGFEGFLPARKLGGDWWDLNEEGTILQGAGTGKSLRIGQRLSVHVRRIEPPRGRVELDVAT